MAKDKGFHNHRRRLCVRCQIYGKRRVPSTDFSRAEYAAYSTS